MLSKVKDYPFLGTLLLIAVVVLHRVLYYRVAWFPDVVGAMSDSGEAWSIYAAFGGVVAIAAGFAGVVVVFALSSESRPFRRLRLAGGDRLVANWVSPVAATLTGNVRAESRATRPRRRGLAGHATRTPQGDKLRTPTASRNVLRIGASW